MIKKEVFSRRGLIFKVDNYHDWMYSHTQVPFGYPIDDKTVRIYFESFCSDVHRM